MAVLSFSPESVFINLVTGVINAYKEKFIEKAKVKVKSKDTKK